MAWNEVAWVGDLADALGVDRLSDEEVQELLDTARDVAHRVERKVTPLSTFLLGIAVGRGETLAGARAKLTGLLPPAEQ